MLMIYFSGTGNSKYIAERFSAKMGGICHSIEEDVDFAALLSAHDTVGVCYPIYGSRVPWIMREFATKHMDGFAGKKLVIFATQLIFSGDGARVFTDLFSKGHAEVIYAAHFVMPNNVNNLFFLRQTSDGRTRRQLARAERQMEEICRDIRNGITRKAGFSGFAKFFGNMQGKAWQGDSKSAGTCEGSLEHKARQGVKVSEDCDGCGLCARICPMKNLVCGDGRVEHRNNCTICYRCVNACPKKAITVFFHAKPKWQYEGIGEQV